MSSGLAMCSGGRAAMGNPLRRMTMENRRIAAALKHTLAEQERPRGPARRDRVVGHGNDRAALLVRGVKSAENRLAAF